MRIASIIIADENQGRRNLLANTFEREGYEVTRLGTLTQTQATASAVLPDVLLMEGEWARAAHWMSANRSRVNPDFVRLPGSSSCHEPPHPIFCPRPPWLAWLR